MSDKDLESKQREVADFKFIQPGGLRLERRVTTKKKVRRKAVRTSKGLF